MPSASGDILSERHGRVGTITINRPPLNILNIAMFDGITTALLGLTSGDQVDIVVIRATGSKAFSAGADIKDHTPEMAPRMLAAFHRVARQLWSVDAVTVAAVHGLALGGGFEMVQCCDIVVASEEAEFGQPEIRIGSFPPIAAAILPGSVGRQFASDILLTGRRISAFEALALGLVSRLAPPGDLDAELSDVVRALSENSGPVMRQAVRALRGRHAQQFSDALSATERIYLEDLLTLDDAREGVEAFLQKRKPHWRGAVKPKETDGA
ncbi:MAG TPA: enoyl-CoA hydratase/isomerase family protein [Candidatus Polarisedimenticolia bacterium]|nr:enoyl-CoA hydratase/isomerase family protein [Candidatus Polarisedimenticolia bacterium]